MRKDASFVSVATALALVTTALGGGMYMGALANDVEQLEQDQVQQKEDHDRLIKVEQKVENIEDDVAETKKDVKEILDAIRKLKED
jgi:septal ring factor EnvC (AmiA/AmiB activator)